MLKYRVKADRDVIVEGLATFKADDDRTFSEYDAEQFFHMRGLKLTQHNVPVGVEVTIIVAGEE